MKNNFLPILILLLMLSAGSGDASRWFKVINVTPIEMTANSEANFTVSVRGLGSERAFVELVFKNRTEGFDFGCSKMIKNVFPGGVTDYECTLFAGDVAAGNYSFIVDVSAKGAPSGKMTAFINVIERASPLETGPEDNADAASQTALPQPMDQDIADQAPPEELAEDRAGEEAERSPMPGAAAVLFCLLVALGRLRRKR
jgi:hypothetical protein